MRDEPANQVFVSYAKADSSWVRGYLLVALKQAGVTYLDQESLTLGAPRVREFERAVRASKRTLLVLSQAWLADDMNQFVDLLAETYGHETSTWPVIPLIRQPVKLPLRLAVLNALEASDEVDWQDAIVRLCAELQLPAPGPEPAPVCPYPGMTPFAEAQSGWFFGRDGELEEVLHRLRLERFLAVIGPSGSGKSSLVHAGVVPALRRTTLFGGAAWVTCVMRPGERPLSRLADALEGPEDDPARAARELLETRGADARLLLVVDQLEELFTVAEAGVEPFQEALLALAEVPGCYVMLTVRADFYPKLMVAPLWRRVRDHRVEVTPLAGEQLRQAIVRPAETVDVFVEATLVDRLIGDAASEPGALPLIQETLLLLWERLERRLLPMRAYRALSVMPSRAYGQPPRTGLQVALARRADAAMAELTPQRQAIAQRILLRLVQFGEGRDDIRRQQSVSALRSVSDNPDDFDATLRHLIDRRLLTASGTDQVGVISVDLCHETLIASWPTFSAWVAKRRVAEETRRRLEAKAAVWINLKKDGGLLDEVELREARDWLDSADAAELGFDDNLVELVWASERAIERDREEREAARRRELEQARALAQAQANRARLLRRMLAVLALLTAVAVGAAVFATSQQRRADQQAQIATSRQLATQARLLASAGQLEHALLLAREADQVHRSAETRSSLLAVLERTPQLIAFLRGHTSLVNSVAFSPNGQTLASASDDHTIVLWDVRTRQPLGEPLRGHTDKVRSVAFSPDGRLLASGSVDKTVIVWDVRTRQPVGEPLRGHTDVVRSVAFSPDGRLLASGSVDQTVIVWDVRTGRPIGQPLRGHTDWVNSVVFIGNGVLASGAGSPDDWQLPAGSRKDYRIIFWDVRSGRRIGQPLMGHSNPVRDLAVSRDHRMLASAGEDSRIILWDLRTRRRIGRPLTGHSARVFCVAFSPDGSILASGSRDHTIMLWDVRTGRRIGQPLDGHAQPIRSLAFSVGGMLASASNDRAVVLWDLARTQRLGQAVPVRLPHVRALAQSHDGRILAVGGEDGRITLIDLPARRVVAVLSGHGARISSLAFSLDGRTLASASWDQTVIVWDTATRMPRYGPLTGHVGAVLSLALSPDGRMLASGGADHTVRLWDLRSGRPLAGPLRGQSDWVRSLAFSPDGHTLATGSQDRTVWLWEVTGGQPRGAALSGPTSPVPSVTFSPDGRTLASGDADGGVALWDLRAPRPAVRPALYLAAHTGEVRSLAYSPDGRMLASSGADGAIQLWDTQTNEAIGGPLHGHAVGIWGVAFSPDGGTLVSGAEDGSLMTWDLRLSSWLDEVCQIANRNLSTREWQHYMGPDRPYQRTCPGLPPANDLAT